MVPRPECKKNLGDEVTLPCGLVLPNRIVKAAMNEALGGWANTPNQKYVDLYQHWANGNWGLLLTGYVHVDRDHLGGLNDISTISEAHFTSNFSSWQSYARTAQSHGTPAIVQLGHGGRQSPLGAGTRGIMAKALAPSAIPMNMGEGWIATGARAIAFGTPKEMTVEEIEDVVEKFITAAKCVYKAGFKGVELHAAHGYLLSTFLSPQTNIRTDAYGGTPEKRTKIVLDIISGIRSAFPASFCVGVKLNSVDASSSSLSDSLQQIQLLAAAGIDFLEISGGSFEDPQMMGASLSPVSARTAAREAYFLEFSEKVRKEFPELLLMVTGGFRTRKGMREAVRNGACDLVGIGRPACVDPKFPKRLLDEKIPDDEAKLFLNKAAGNFITRWSPVKGLAAGMETAYYYKQIRLLSEGKPTSGP